MAYMLEIARILYIKSAPTSCEIVIFLPLMNPTSITEQSSKASASGLHDPTYFHFIYGLSAHRVVFSSWIMGCSCWWQRKRGPVSLKPIGLYPSKQFYFMGSYDKATAMCPSHIFLITAAKIILKLFSKG